MNVFGKLVMGVALLTASASAVIAQGRPSDVKVGVFTFTSGPAAAYGVPGRNAAELIVEQMNASGGIAGVPLRPTFVDEAQGTAGVIAEFRRLAADPSFQLMVAALSSSNCLALAPVSEQLKMPTIAWNCDTHQLFLKDDLKYTVRPNGNTIPEFIAYALYLLEKKPDVKRIAIINPDYAFGHDAAAIFKAAMKTFKPDVEVVAELFPKLGASTYQTEISRLAAARADVIFSNLWGADLENFVRQAQPRGLFSTSQVVLALGETILQSVGLPPGVIVGVLGDGWWMSPDAQANPRTVQFVEAYRMRYGSYPVFPSIKMANSFLVLQEAYEKAIKAKGGGWPTRDELASAMRGLTVKTLTGEISIRKDNEGVVDQVVGVTVTSPSHKFPLIGEMVRYPGDSLLPPPGGDPIKWISTLPQDFRSKLPKPGSYK